MGWMFLVALGIVGLATIFVILTDGRYFGKGLTYWIYNRFGPAIFSLRSEAEQWHKLADALQLRGDEMVLDVGTAAGDLPLTIAARPLFRGQVVGIDWAPRMIAVAQAEAKRRQLDSHATFKTVDIRKPLPFPNGKFDLVISLGLLETLPHPEQVILELTRVLKPGGTLVLSLYRGWSAWSVALSFDWYQQHLAVLGFQDFQVLSGRRSHDVVIARSAEGEWPPSTPR